MVDAQNVEPEAPEVVAEPEKQFSQADVDAIVQKRLEREQSQRQKAIEDALAQDREKRRIAALEGEEKVKAEYEAKLAEVRKAQDERDEAYRQVAHELAVTKAQAKLATLGLPPELANNVIGEDDKATDRNISALNKAVNDLVAKRVNEGLNHGTPRAGGSKPTDDEAALLDRVMGISRS